MLAITPAARAHAGKWKRAGTAHQSSLCSRALPAKMNMQTAQAPHKAFTSYSIYELMPA